MKSEHSTLPPRVVPPTPAPSGPPQHGAGGILWAGSSSGGREERLGMGTGLPQGSLPHMAPLMSPSCCPREAGKGARLGAGGSLQRPPAGGAVAA